MRTYFAIAGVVGFVALAIGCSSSQLSKVRSTLAGKSGTLDTRTVTAGLKEALQVGIKRAVNRASSEGAYADNPELHISLPDELDKMKNALETVGLGGQMKKLENKMNLAAEEAAGQATPVFIDAIKDMSFADARKILSGKDTAATEYLRKNTSDKLASLYEPIVQKHLQTVGVMDLYNQLHSRYQSLPLAPSVDFQPSDHVTTRALDGLFQLLAQEEQKIRAEPAARSTELLKRVFGSQN